MVVIQITLKVYLKENVPSIQAQQIICRFIDGALCKKEEFKELHNARKYKMYCYNSLYPISEDRIYHKNQTYQLQIRTVDTNLAEYFANELNVIEDRIIKIQSSAIEFIAKKEIEKLYSITPTLMKRDDGYWRDCISVEEYMESIKINLIKKYNAYTNTKLDEEFDFIKEIQFSNRVPIKCAYKNVNLLGDKIDIQIASNERAQQLAYFALGVGILEGNARGFGYMKDKWKKVTIK
ncbi:CRISPR-associated endoribonuclease Cas6 [Anaerosporobacter sp.]|uniref:CRISPR-associated endoribonuclease Cas6 n=1 Tax=Anaerosporobacter sp. TaxID=1872529 RepID=UPI00286EC38E|nr:CRISPR-associated endoribonuclease Cas6 [Anaerosporobacter sp.]